MIEGLGLRVVASRRFIRQVVTRMPFRYGSAVLTRVPVEHLELTVEHGRRRATGWAADCLPPAWFDKRPGRTFRDGVEALRWSVSTAVQTVLEAGPGTAFGLWRVADEAVRSAGAARDEAGLTCGFGPAMAERALIDAAGKLCGATFYESVRRGLLGIDLGALAPELGDLSPADFLVEPLELVAVRHTVGLADPITGADLTPDARLGDGLPRTLEEVLSERSPRYFKVKVCGRWQADRQRLLAVAAVLDGAIPGAYVVSLDGNEQYHDWDEVEALLAGIRSEPALRRLAGAIEYLEQPLARSLALVGSGPPPNLGVPVIIDESDDRHDAFEQALALGYAGVSAKNCKGVSRAIANHCLASRRTAVERPARPYLVTGEDLMNTAAIPLQQDLATAALLGLRHVERNGHHYVRGLDHLSPAERAACLDRHAGLYEPFAGGSAQLRICDGLLDLRSLAVPGYAVAFEPDESWMVPGDRWRFEDLGL